MSRHSASYQVPRDLLDKYNVKGPRYTSYPTAPEWSDSVTTQEIEEAIARNNRERAHLPISLYVHIPFCSKLCYYCGCNMMVTRNEELVERYLQALEGEIAAMAERIDRRRPVVQIHWGGGTPTHLSPTQIERLYRALTAPFTLEPDAEISIEVHPPVTTRSQLETLRRLGFNRISMGVQDFDPEVQKAVNRIQTFEQTRDLIAACRELGFLSVNIDLMYGLPFQTLPKFERTLDLVDALRPDRIALFNYAHVPWLKPHQKLIKEETLPAPEEKIQLFERAIARFLDQGYRYIGMDHFALPENELAIAQADRSLRRNFMGYTTCADSDLYSFGVSAISDLDDAYYQNPREIEAYMTGALQGLPATRGMWLTADDQLRRDVINRLICHCHLEKREIEAAHGIDFDATFARELTKLPPLAEDGLVGIAPERITVSPRGQVLLRNICMVWDAYLEQRQGEQMFSRTV